MVVPPAGLVLRRRKGVLKSENVETGSGGRHLLT